MSTPDRIASVAGDGLAAPIPTPIAAEQAKTRPKLGTPTKALYGLSMLATSSKAQLAGLVLLFYNQLVGLDAPLVSFALSVALLVDAFWDPFVGQWSDNTRTRLGRRHPFIYLAVVPAAVCFALLFRPPLAWSDNALFFYLLVIVIAGRMLDSLYEVPMAAIAPELTHDYHERTSVQAWRFAFNNFALGGALTAVLGYGVFLRGAKGDRYGQLHMAGYAPYAATIAAVSVVAVLIAALATQRFTPFMHTPKQRKPSLGAIAREVGLSLSNRNFVALAASSLIFGISVGITGGLIIYLYTYFWELGTNSLLVLRLATLPAGLAGVVLAPYGARWLGKKRACITIFFLAVFSTTVPIALRLVGWMPPNGSPWVMRILTLDTMATGALASFGFVIVSAMLSDVTEDAQLRTGQRSEGLLFATEQLLRKLTTAFSVMIPGVLLTLVHFPMHAQPGHVAPGVLRNLALVYLPLTTGLTLCSTSALLFYRIDHGRHEANLARLDEHSNDAAALAEAVDPIVGA